MRKNKLNIEHLVRKDSKIQWVRFFSRGHHPLLYIDSVMWAHRSLFRSYFHLPPVTHWVRHSGSLWVDEVEMQKIFEALRRKLYTPWPHLVLQQMKRDLQKLNHFAWTTRHRYQTVDLRQLFHLMYPAWLTTYFPIMIGKVIGNEVDRLSKSLPISMQKKIAVLLNMPLYPSVRQLYLVTLRAGSKRDSHTWLNRVVQNFGWINTYVMDVKPLTTKKVLAESQRLQQQFVRVIVPRISLEPRLKQLVKLGRLYCWFRDWRLFEISKFYYYYKPIFVARGKELGLNYKQVRQLTVAEFLSGNFQKRDVISRLKEFGSLLLGKNIFVVTGSRLKLVKRDIRERVGNRNIREVKGIPANPGLVRGRVKLADSYSFHTLKLGDVVVTAETSPDAVPYLRKVRAIITDEGGITSHASIISRELDIPCVIATKIATKVFKNGDIVEVDANKGVVKFIKKSRSH